MRHLRFLIPLIVVACSASVKKDPALDTPSADTVVSTLPTDTNKTQWQYSKSDLLGKFNPADHCDFSRIAPNHTTKENIYMRREAYAAFTRMYDAAKKEGVTLKIISATRNFEDQKRIWEKKWIREKYKGWSEADKAKDILLYSSMPGTSRHHWGTDVDFNSVELNYFEQPEGKKLYAWLVSYAAQYGYVQTYTSKKDGRTGYQEEKWHWSYLPIAGKMLEEFNATITYEDISGFSGCKAAKDIRVIEDYVNGVDPKN